MWSPLFTVVENIISKFKKILEKKLYIMMYTTDIQNLRMKYILFWT
jgi:hypothetical protein